MTWLHALHSNVCRSVPGNAGMIWASIIWAWHFGQAGRLMGASGTMDDMGWGSAIVDPSKSVSATPGIIGPVQRAELQLNKYARPVVRSLFNIAQFPKTASCCFLVFH